MTTSQQFSTIQVVAPVTDFEVLHRFLYHAAEDQSQKSNWAHYSHQMYVLYQAIKHGGLYPSADLVIETLVELNKWLQSADVKCEILRREHQMKGNLRLPLTSLAEGETFLREILGLYFEPESESLTKNLMEKLSCK